MGDGTWAHFGAHLTSTHLARKSLPEIAAFGANLLSHLLEQPNSSDHYAGNAILFLGLLFIILYFTYVL